MWALLCNFFKLKELFFSYSHMPLGLSWLRLDDDPNGSAIVRIGNRVLSQSRLFLCLIAICSRKSIMREAATRGAYACYAYADTQGKAPSVRSVRARLTARANARGELCQGQRRRDGAVWNRNKTKWNEMRVLPAPGTARPSVSARNLAFSRASSLPSPLHEISSFSILLPPRLRHFHELHQDHRRVLLHTSLEEMRIINHESVTSTSLQSVEIRDRLRCLKWKEGAEFK